MRIGRSGDAVCRGKPNPALTGERVAPRTDGQRGRMHLKHPKPGSRKQLRVNCEPVREAAPPDETTESQKTPALRNGRRSQTSMGAVG